MQTVINILVSKTQKATKVHLHLSDLLFGYQKPERWVIRNRFFQKQNQILVVFF